MISEMSKRQKEIEAPVSGELPLIHKLNSIAEEAARKAVIDDIHQGQDSNAETAVKATAAH